MSDNLIFLINKLSHLIVSQEFENEKNQIAKNEKHFNCCIRKVSQKGCDVLLNKTKGTQLSDPCLTDYGGNWSPLTLITDYGRELKAQGGGKYNDLLLSSLQVLEEKNYDCTNELLKFLLLLKRPIPKESTDHLQSELSFNGSESLLNSVDSMPALYDDYPSDGLSRRSSFKKALQYEESWTKNFDQKFHLLGECSKKNLLAHDKVSLNSIFPSRPTVNSHQSRSNSFVFPDFSTLKNYGSDKSLFDVNSFTYVNDSVLLDNFVEHPISHKLPPLTINTKFASKRGSRGTIGSEECGKAPEWCSSEKSSAIELKRDSNCSHSFSILYKSARDGSLVEESSENFSFGKDKKKDWASNASCTSGSRDVVFGLWAQEQKLLKEFNPELSLSWPSLRMISLTEYVEDVKHLFTGINSGTFNHDDVHGFRMMYGTCLDNVTPDSLYHFSREFLDIGNCYLKLSSCVTLVGKNSFDTCTTISQAFWKSIFDFLELHYSLVLEIPPAVNLMALKSCTKDLYEIIKTVANICQVLKKEKVLPVGGKLLTYLLQVAEQTTKNCVTNIIFGILQNCCNVYFMCILQNWMFRGILENQEDEFFVDYRRQKVSTKSRAHYNSFYVVNEKIPCFLRGHEESIFNCGKSIHFLKLFNPEDKFCQILDKAEYPSMHACFSEEELEKLEMKFKNYEKEVIKVCGERITIKTIKKEEEEKEKVYAEYVKECKLAQEEKRKVEIFKQLQQVKETKDKQNKLLNQHLALIKAEKERRKEEEEKKRMKWQAETERARTKLENMVNEEKTLMKLYGEEIMEKLDRRLKVAETRKESLQKIISSEAASAESLDGVVDNKLKTDAEGNLTNIFVDTNSNPTILMEVKPSQEFKSAIEILTPETDSKCSSIIYDENLNPSVRSEEDVYDKNSDMSEFNPRKSVSHRTVAAEEAEKNKCRVLKSEFGLLVRKESSKVEKKKENVSLTDLEKNRRKVLDSEYNLLKRPSTSLSSKSVSPKDETESVKNSSEDIQIVDEFRSVSLERKNKCTNLEEIPEKPLQSQTVQSESLESLMSSSNELIQESVSNGCTKAPEVNSMVVRERYQSALERDADLVQNKLSYQHFFCTLKDEYLDNLPCTDFMMFQRCLTKSVLIPLKIQEKLANDALLKHLLKGENLLSHLKSLRGYFFFNDGEFGRSFTHHTFRSLSKCMHPNQFFERNNLSNIVNEALNYTIHNCDPNAQNLSFKIVKMPPFLNHSSHDVLAPFELSYKVDWPLNIILTDKALSKYRMVFQFLLKLKRINWTLNDNFLYLNSHFKGESLRLKGKVLSRSPHYHKIQIYRHAMTQVMITLDDYIFSNGVQLPWIFFLKDLETTQNIDHLYQKHVRYIKDVLTRCFLSKNSEDLLESIYGMIELALKFHYTAKSSVFQVTEKGLYEHPKFQVLKTTFNEFCSVIKVFLKTLKEKIGLDQVLKSHYVLIEKFDMKLS